MDMGRKTAVVVVFFKPDQTQVARFMDLSQDYLVIAVDNSDTRLDKKFGPGFIYIPLCGNKGIAAAQNVGIRKAKSLGAERCVFFDQDSDVSARFVSALLSEHGRIVGLREDVAAVGPIVVNKDTGNAYKTKGEQFGDDYCVVSSIFSSGSVISMNAFDLVGVMKEELFIDFVDTEWCWRARSKGLVCCLTTRLEMPHRVGLEERIFLGHPVLVAKPQRYYYLYRNIIILIFTCRYMPHRSRLRLSLRYLVEWIYVFFVSEEKRKVLKNVIKGTRDGFGYVFCNKRRSFLF